MKAKIHRSRAVTVQTTMGNDCIGTVWINQKKDTIVFTATSSLTPETMIEVANAMTEYLKEQRNEALEIPKH